MLIVRWFTGLLKRLFAGWDDREWLYYNVSGLDPKPPAYQRWSVRMKDREQPAADERDLPEHSYSVMLEDKYGLTAEDLVYNTKMLDKAQAVLQHFERELQTRSCGDFYYNNIRNRRLDFFHNFRAVGNEPLEGSAEIDEEAEREKFLR
jgi:hypothetical protein